LLGALVTFGASSGLTDLYLPAVSEYASGGGLLGDFVSTGLTTAFGLFGGSVFMLVLLLAGFTLATGLSWVGVLELLGKLVLGLLEWLQAALFDLIAKISLPDFKRSTHPSKEPDTATLDTTEATVTTPRKTRKKTRREPTVATPPASPPPCL
jgi:S-DNA-T family DNA segregation ATPase FtsK/SpoIIIE